MATGSIIGFGGHGYRAGRATPLKELLCIDVASLPPMDVAGAGRSAAAALAGAGCDALLVTHLANIRYLTGFTGSAALLLVLPDALLFVTDGRYERAGGRAAGRGRRRGRRRDRSHAASEQRALVAAAASGAGRVGLEADT